MPKAAKKKAEKHADFTKVKLKLGKGKKVASNATDTSFKARSIALPGQSNLSRALTSTEEPTTNGGLTLDEVVLRFRHPNGGVRKESLGGVKDILTVDPSREVGKVVRALGGLVSDDDAGVRKSLLSFLSWYIAAIPETVLTPHLPLLLLQTSSALSHIFPEIRLDACKLVALLLEHVPTHVVGSWPASTSTASSSKNTLDGGNIILEGLRLAVGLGGEKGASSTMGKLGSTGRLTTLSTLLSFTKCALEKDMVDTDGIFADWVPGSEGKGKGRAVDVSLNTVWPEGWLVGPPSWGLDNDVGTWDVSRLNGAGLEDEEGQGDAVVDLYLQLAPLLQSTFLESAPTAFSPSSAPPHTLETPTQLCLTAASLTSTLSRHIFRSKPRSEVRIAVSDFLHRMSPYFPFKEQSGPSPTGLTPSLELDIIYANLALLLAPSTPDLVLPKNLRKELGWRERIKAVEEAWKGMRKVSESAKDKKSEGWALDEVAEWIIDVLAPKKDILAPPLTLTTYTALLPIIWSLLVQPPSAPPSADDTSTVVGTAFFSHLLRQGSSTAIRAHGDRFIVDLLAVHEQRHPKYPFFIPTSSSLRLLFTQWVENVPKTLWELGTKDEVATGALLRFLLGVALRGPGSVQAPFSLYSNIDFPGVASKMAPFFHLAHPSKGNIPGPWTRLANPTTRKLALDVARVWLASDRGALQTAVQLAVKARGGTEEAYWNRGI